MKRIIALLLALAVTLPLGLADEPAGEAPPAEQIQVQEGPSLGSEQEPSEDPAGAPADGAADAHPDGSGQEPSESPAGAPADGQDGGPADGSGQEPSEDPAGAPDAGSGDGSFEAGAQESAGESPDEGGTAQQDLSQAEEEAGPAGADGEQPARQGAWGPLAWSLSNGTLTVSGSGAGPDCAQGAAPWYALRDEVARAAVRSGVTRIGARAFSDCGELAEISIAQSVASIGEGAFSGCAKLRRVSYGGSEEDWVRVAIAGGNAAVENAAVTCAQGGDAQEPAGAEGEALPEAAEENVPENAAETAEENVPENEPENETETAPENAAGDEPENEPENGQETAPAAAEEGPAAQGEGELAAQTSLAAAQLTLGAHSDEESGKVHLSWDRAWNGAEYAVYRSTAASGKYAKIASTGETDYTDTYPAAGKAFWYKVEAQDDSGNKIQSAPVRGKAVCARPAVTAAADPATGKYTVKWGKVQGAAKYEVTREEEGGGPVRIALLYSNNTSVRDGGVPAGKTVTYRVRAVAASAANSGAWSEGVTVHVRCAAPALSAGSDPASGKPALSWKAVEGAEGYEISRGGAVVCVTEATAWQDDSCVPGDRFTYGVRALGQTDIYDGEPSEKEAVCACAAPEVTAAHDEDTGCVVLSWEARQGAASYEIWRAATSRAKYRKIAVTEDTSWTERAAVGKAYWYKVRCLSVGQGADSALSGAVALPGACARPSVTVSASEATGKCTVRWNKVTGASKYEVWRARQGEDPVRIALLAGSKTSYTDGAATAGGTYAYAVKAVGSKAAYSSAMSWTEQIPVRCGMPSLSVKNDAASGKPALSWKAVEGAAAYEISRDGAAVCETELTAWQDGTAVPGTRYSYAVRALARESAYDGAAAEKGAVCACAAPELTAANDPDTGRAALSWGGVPGAGAYEIQRAATARASFRKVAVVNGTEWMDKAAVGKTYWYRVRALGGESGSDSAPGNVVTLSGACAKPSVTALNDAATGRNVLNWDKVAGAASYEILRAEGNGELQKAGSVRSSVTKYTDPACEAGTAYRYAVRAVGSKAAYSGAPSDVVTRLCVCAAPAASAGNDGATGAVAIRWNAVAGAAYYVVERDTGAGFAVLCETEALECLDGDIPVGAAYRYRVRAAGQAPGTDSAAGSAVSGLRRCAAPAAQAAADPASGRPRLSWQEVAGALKYEIFRSAEGSTAWKKIATVSSLSYTDSSAPAGATYRYRLRTVHRTSKYSSGYCEPVPCPSVCAAPVLTAVTEPNSGKVSLSWKAVQGAAYYEVCRLAGGGAGALTVEADGLSWTDTDIPTGCTGTYRVRAVGSSGEYDGAFSAEASLQCLPARPTLTGVLEGDIPYLMWSVCDEAALYRVYTCESENGHYTLIWETDETAFLYVDAPVGREMYYRVSCVTQSGCESVPSTPGMLKAYPDRTYYRKGTTSTEMPEGYGSVQIGAPVTSEQAIEYIIFVAQTQLGKQYSYTPAAPRNFDCATLVYYCFKRAGVTIPGSAYGQGNVDYGEKITKISDLKRGDIVSFNTNEKDGDPYDHSGIYLGGGWFIHASSGAGYVVTSTLSTGYYKEHFTLGRRVFGD